jgi:uncharacterized damage-inducible protein DinB
MSISATPGVSAPLFISAPELLVHWQGHRRLTRRLIEAFPEDRLFSYSVGSMRPFGVMAMELISMAEPMVRGIVTTDWTRREQPSTPSKADLLRQWDESTAALDRLWSQIPPERFQETMTAFGQYPGKVHDLVLYVVDNEIHHRGQGYVYLRTLGIEPPPFYERV